MLSRMTAAIAIAIATLSSSVSAVGVCYSPFHSDLYFTSPSQIESILVRDFQTIAAQGFTSVRTYHAQFYGYNVVRAAQQTGLHVAIGIQMTNSVGSGEYEFLQQDIDAAIWAGNNVPELVDAIYAGNENLKNGDHGFATADRIIQVIQQVRSGLTNKNIPVGTVQRLEEWLTSADADTLAANSDVVGANIYPFFTHGGQYDMKGQLEAQWSKFASKFGAKARLTETGWATEGSTLAAGNIPSLDTATQYYNAFLQWSKSSGAQTPYYFMMFDVPSAAGADYEKHFGLATSTGELKFKTSSSSELRENDSASTSSSSSSTSPETPPPVEGPLDTVVPPTETPEPTTATPEPTTNEPTPEPTPTLTPTLTPAPTHAGSSSSGSGSNGEDIVVPTSRVPSSSGSSSTTGSGDAGYEPTPTKTNNGPTPTPTHAAATVPAPTTLSPEAQAAKDAAAREASSREARAVSGGSGVSFFMFGSVAAVMGVVAIVVIAVYMKRQNQDEEAETRTVAASSIDPRASTPSSVYDDPLGTRFSSIVMITPNGDGVCIL